MASTATADQPATLTVTLDPGTYWALDTNANDASKFFEFTVAGLDTGNVAPDADVTLKAKGSAKWSNKPASMPKKGVFTFTNAASQNHFIEMIKLKKGKTVEDFKDWFLNPDGPSGPPPADFSAGGLSTGVISPGHVDDRRLQDRQGQLRDALLLAGRHHGRHAARLHGHDPRDQGQVAGAA